MPAQFMFSIRQFNHMNQVLTMPIRVFVNLCLSKDLYYIPMAKVTNVIVRSFCNEITFIHESTGSP